MWQGKQTVAGGSVKRSLAMASQACGTIAKAFRSSGYYWLIVDQSEKGLAVYRSTDATRWTKQPESLLVTPGTGEDDKVHGGHADAVVSGDRAFLFYLICSGRLTCDPDQPTHIRLSTPDRRP